MRVRARRSPRRGQGETRVILSMPMDAKPPGSIGPDGRCVSCAKRVQTTGGCIECLGMRYAASEATSTSPPSLTITVAPVGPVQYVSHCPHARSDWRHCPHCLGINGNGGTR